MSIPASLAIAVASGGFKGVFAHGVLDAFEAAGVHAAAYAGASSTVLPAAFAALGMARAAGVAYWEMGLDVLEQAEAGMSEVVLGSIAHFAPLRPRLFETGRPRFLIPTSEIITAEASELAQGIGATRLGRQLLLAAARGDSEWVERHLRLAVFDTEGREHRRLTSDNFDAVVYASTRMLHAWRVPAWVDGRPYADASYTCACLATELAAEYAVVIAVGNDVGPVYHDLFRTSVVLPTSGARRIDVVTPKVDPAQRGVTFTTATRAGLRAVYEDGRAQGDALVHRLTERDVAG